MSKMSREKGKRGEREVAEILRKHGFKASRETRNWSDDHEDLTHNVEGVHIEVKRAERLCLPQWTKQAEEDAEKGDLPVVAYRTNGEPWRASLLLEDLIYLFMCIQRPGEAAK